MTKILVFSANENRSKAIDVELRREGFECESYRKFDDIIKLALDIKSGAIIIDGCDQIFESWIINIKSQLQHIKRFKDIPVLTLISQNMIRGISNVGEIDDFSVEPYTMAELLARLNRLISDKLSNGKNDVIKQGDLVINVVNCEVLLSGKLVSLTFTEYELLKLLASNKGRVFSREALLNEIWGYDYYGGDRTVDVHIRRLRSKIEDSAHSFIDTVRNIGYKFRDDSRSGI